jgi:molecular chaperone GrpE
MNDSTQRTGQVTEGEDANGDPTAPPQGELAQAQRQRDDYFEQLQRTRAEFANYQKRSKAQADADRAYAVGSLARDLLDAIDNLERAAGALRASSAGGITEGLDMVQKQLVSILAKHGVEPIAALGKPFDPNEHEALVQQPDAEHPEGTVVAELGKGYRIRDRVLRPTKVAVSVKPATS